MAFNTENRKISEIYQRASRYIIPRYQRGYVWKKQNWSELLNDIKFTIDVDNNIDWSHFLGTIVLSKITNTGTTEGILGITDYEIIDGQQRLTTIYIILIAIHHKFKEIDEDEPQNRANYIYQNYLTSTSASNKKINLLHNPDLEKNILEILDLDPFELPKKNNELFELYHYYHNEFKNYTFEQLDEFLANLLEINIVEIISDKEEEIYNIFEVLNARGQKLKQIELLKNHIMKYILPREDKFIDSAKEKWNEILHNVKEINDPDNLINHFTKCYIKKNAENADSVYKLIKEEVNIKELSTFLDDLTKYSYSYVEVTDKNTTDRTIEYFNIKRNQQIRSLLAAIHLLYKEEIISEETKIETFKNIANYFFIFNADSQTSNKTDNPVSEAAYGVYHAKSEIDFKFVMSNFFQTLNKNISNINMKSILKSNNSFRYSNKDKTLKRNSRLVKYILISLMNLEQHDSVLDPKQLTIEHLISDDGNTDNSLLQNLTLTTEEINSDMLSNKPIEEKLKILKDKSSIVFNQTLDKYWENNQFDFVKRNIDLSSDLIEKCFKFDPYLFNIKEDDVFEYYNNKNLLEDHPELLEILHSSGNRFLDKLNNDPKLTGLKQDYEILLL